MAKWLKVWRHKEELAQVEAIKAESAREILRELVRIFDPEAGAQEIDAVLSVYDYLEERRKFREHLMTHGLGELETLRRERETSKRERDELARERDILQRERDTFRNELDTLKQKNDRLKSELEDAKRKQSAHSQASKGKRVDIPAGSLSIGRWTNIIPSNIRCKITNIGNCDGFLMIGSVYGETVTISESCSRKILHNGIAVYLLYKCNTDLYFDYEEV